MAKQEDKCLQHAEQVEEVYLETRLQLPSVERPTAEDLKNLNAQKEKGVLNLLPHVEDLNSLEHAVMSTISDEGKSTPWAEQAKPSSEKMARELVNAKIAVVDCDGAGRIFGADPISGEKIAQAYKGEEPEIEFLPDGGITIENEPPSITSVGSNPVEPELILPESQGIEVERTAAGGLTKVIKDEMFRNLQEGLRIGRELVVGDPNVQRPVVSLGEMYTLLEKTLQEYGSLDYYTIEFIEPLEEAARGMSREDLYQTLELLDQLRQQDPTNIGVRRILDGFQSFVNTLIKFKFEE